MLKTGLELSFFIIRSIVKPSLTKIYSEEELMLENLAFESFTVSNLH